MRFTPTSQGFNLPPAAAGSTSTIIPQVTTQETLANLGIGATIDFDFNVDFNPVFDVFVFADQVIDVEVYIRQSVADTFRRLNNAIYATGVANQMRHVIQGVRFPGSIVRIRLVNNSGVATTSLSAQAHSRSL